MRLEDRERFLRVLLTEVMGRSDAGNACSHDQDVKVFAHASLLVGPEYTRALNLTTVMIIC
jgi:hypothetical protein